MKRIASFLLLAGFLVSVAVAHPGLKRDSKESDEVAEKDGILLVLPNRRNIFDEIAERDSLRPQSPVGIWDFPVSTPSLDGILARMQELMRRVSANFEAALQESAIKSQLNKTNPWGFKLPTGANTTSTTKVVGNHSVTINETTHSQNDELGSSVFHWKIVEVKPLNETIISTSADKSTEDKIQPEKPQEELDSSVTDRPDEIEDTNKSEKVNEIPKTNQVEIIRA